MLLQLLIVLILLVLAIAVFPALELVIAHKTNNVYRRTTAWDSWHTMLEMILEAKGVDVGGDYPWR